ncbi:MAG: AMP-binding protein [Actinobacteria bacterium]|nr:AMP-binding protein [Actinomycetota bacterium]
MALAWWARRIGNRPAITSPAGDRTFEALNARANQLARALRRRGLGAGDAVALICTNRPEFAEVVFACLRAGLRLTPINWHLTGGEAAYIVGDCEARAVIADARLAAVATGAVAGAPAGVATVRMAVGADIDGFEPYDDAVAAEDASDLPDPVPGTSMLYTSGTTGRPKGVHRPPEATSAVTVNIYGYEEGGDDRHLCTGPLYHAAPLAFSLAAPLNLGVGVVLMESWDAGEALRLVERHRITHTHMVPTMFHRLLSLPADVRERYDTSSLRYVLHGAAPCPVPVKAALMDWLGPVVWEYYAATEGVGTFVDPQTWLQRPGTVGKPGPADQVLVGDERGDPLPAGEIGLVYIKAPATGRFEYFKDADKTAGTYRGDHFTLGDVGYLDEDGYLYLTDRTANLIISGGVNIYPAEVDAVLLGHPAVGDAATIGVPNSEWGEEVRAVVELQPGVMPSEELAAELVAYCRERLAGFKCPRAVDFIDELPRQDNGKIYKRLLRDRYRAGA